MTNTPTNLRPHPAIVHMPRPAKDSLEWTALVQDISDNGVKHPLQITRDNQVIDGETRRQAAIAAGLAEVPVQVINDSEIFDTIRRELSLRRNLNKSQLAFIAFPMMLPAFDGAKNRSLSNLRKGSGSPTPTELSSGNISEIGGIWGISHEYVRMAKTLFSFLENHPEKREMVEHSLFVGDKKGKPASLGGVLAGLGVFMDGANPDDGDGSRHPGGKPKSAARQMELFADILKSESERWDYWQQAEPAIQASYWRSVRMQAESLDPATAEARADYHRKLASAFSSRAKGG